MTTDDTEIDVEELVIKILKNCEEKLSTREIEEKVSGHGKKCPDSAVRFLSKLRYKGLINGELSMEHRGWIWWVD